jgi:hypothetical protein
MPNDPNQPSAAKIKALLEEQKKKKMIEMMQQKAGGMAPPSTDDARQQMMQKMQQPKPFAKGGTVRGVGCARKGHGKGSGAQR